MSLVLMLALAVPAFAQQITTGSVNGTVTDSTGAVVSGATVTATDVDRKVSFPATTDNAGLYTIQRLPIGKYVVTAEKAGFKKAKYPAFVLQLNQVAEVNITLTAGDTTTVVEVQGTAPLLETGSTELSTVIDSKATENIPLPTRNYNQLTLLTAGAVNPNPGSFTGAQATFQTGRPYINGNREQTNKYVLDGMDNSNHDNNDVAYAPNVDAIQEFNLISSNAPADFGDYLGGVVNVSLKSGTNDIHGDAFWYVRNTIFNANEWANNLSGQNTSGDEFLPRNQVHWNAFGGTIGGPIIKDKLFFFADYQGSMFHTGLPGTAQVLTTAEKGGDFSALGETLYMPSAGTAPAARPVCASGNLKACGGTEDPAVAALLNSSFYPTPTGAGGSANGFAYHIANKNDGKQGDFKLDYHPSAQDSLYVRVSMMDQENPVTPTFLLSASGFQNFSYPLQNVVVGWNRTLTPSLVNTLTAGISHFPITQGYAMPGGNNLPSLIGLPSPSNLLPAINTANLAQANVFSKINGFGYGNNGSGLNNFEDSELDINDGIVWTKGKNEFHFGGEWILYKDNDFYPGNEGAAGEFDFGNTYTSNGTTGGDGVADFWLGLPDGIALGGNNTGAATPSAASTINNHFVNDLFAFYGQDNLRLTTKLTVNVGLRYEAVTPRNLVDNSAVNWNLATGAAELSGPGGNTTNQAGYNGYYGLGDFQPRVGFAWQAVKNTVIRGAFGISEFEETNGANNQLNVNPPYFDIFHINYGAATGAAADMPASTFSQGFAPLFVGACTPAGVIAFSPNCYAGRTLHLTDPNLKPSFERSWNFSIQHQFGNSTTFQVGYVGESTYHLSNIVNPLQQIIAPGNPAGDAPSPLLPALQTYNAANPGNAIGSVRLNLTNGIARYNALQAVLTQRLAHGLQAQLNLTWSKCLSDTPGYFGLYGDAFGLSQTFGGWAFPQDTWNQKADYGLCNYDARVAFNGYVVYDLPFGRGRQFASNMNKVLDGVVGGWSVQTDFQFHTGMPWDILGVYGFLPTSPGAASFSNAPRPDCVPGVPQHLPFQMAPASVGFNAFQFLNPASVAAPPVQTDGNCPVDSHTGLGLKTMDLAVAKTFHMTERQSLELRMEGINFTNTPIYALSSGAYWGSSLNATSPAFGTVSNSEGARQLQFGLKYHF